jgi:nucleoside-diphosphate-sugar epimerase
MKRVLVTGALGFIGQRTLPLLSARGFEVHAVTSRQTLPVDRNETWHRANLLDARQIDSLITTVAPTHLLHLAWIATPGIYEHSAENLLWLEASTHLIHAFSMGGGQRLVAAGSCAEYDWRYGFCNETLTPTAPQSLYGVCKLALEMILRALAKESKLSVAWGRIFFPYGPHEHPKRLVASVIRSLLMGKPAECTDGRQVRDFVFVDDVANAFATLLDSELYGTVNIASGRGITVREVVSKIGDILERCELVRFGGLESTTAEAPLIVGDIRRIGERFNWSPKYDLDQGLRVSVEWWRKQPHRESEQHEAND